MRAINKLYLFYPTSLIGFLICLVTRSPYAHAAVMVDGVLYDASENRHTFDRSDIDPRQRGHISIEFAGDLRPWLENMMGRRYDWRGVIMWLFGKGDDDRVYCFEAAWHALHTAGVVSGHQPKRLSGSDLYALVAQHNGSAGRRAIDDARSILALFAGGESDRFLRLLDGFGAHEVAMQVLKLALDCSEAGNTVSAVAELAARRQVQLDFEEALYARMAQLESLAGISDTRARDSPVLV